MIAARLLVELGWAPDKAMATIRQVRPGVLETRGHETFVLALSPAPEAKPHQSSAAIRDNATETLVGLAWGSVGTTLDFRPRDSYSPLDDMVSGEPFRLQLGHWIDDTAMALAPAGSLLECDGLDQTHLMERFGRWQETDAYSCISSCFDIGSTVAAAPGRWRTPGNPFAGAADKMSRATAGLRTSCLPSSSAWARRDISWGAKILFQIRLTGF